MESLAPTVTFANPLLDDALLVRYCFMIELWQGFAVQLPEYTQVPGLELFALQVAVMVPE